MCYSTPKVYTYSHFSSERVHCVGFRYQNPQFWANLDIWGLLYRPPFTDEVQLWCVTAHPRSTLTHTFHLSVFIVSASGTKIHNFGQILTFGGSCTDTLLPMTAKFSALEQTQGIRLRAKFRLDRFILLPSGGETPPFFAGFGLRHLVMLPIGINLRKLSTGAQLQTCPYLNVFCYPAAGEI